MFKVRLILMTVIIVLLTAMPGQAKIDHWTWQRTHYCSDHQWAVLHWKVYGDRITVGLTPDPRMEIVYLKYGQHTGVMPGRGGFGKYTGYIHVDDNNFFERAWITCKP